MAPFSVHIYMGLEELSRKQKKCHCLYALPFFCFSSHSSFQFHIKHPIYFLANVKWAPTSLIYLSD